MRSGRANAAGISRDLTPVDTDCDVEQLSAITQCDSARGGPRVRCTVPRDL